MTPYVTSSVDFISGVGYSIFDGSRRFSMYFGIEFIGPGRYSEIAATRSSKQFGTRPMSSWRIPPDSSWNTPSVLPSDSIR